MKPSCSAHPIPASRYASLQRDADARTRRVAVWLLTVFAASAAGFVLGVLLGVSA